MRKLPCRLFVTSGKADCCYRHGSAHGSCLKDFPSADPQISRVRLQSFCLVIENHDIVFRSIQTSCEKPSCLASFVPWALPK